MISLKRNEMCSEPTDTIMRVYEWEMGMQCAIIWLRVFAYCNCMCCVTFTGILLLDIARVRLSLVLRMGPAPC